MTDDSVKQLEQAEALRRIEAQMEKGATMLESIQSALKKASLLAKSQDTEQFEYGEAGRLITAMWERDQDRWRRQAGIADERDEEREKCFQNAEAVVRKWIEVTASVLESISPVLADRFLGFGAFFQEPRTMRERVIDLEKRMSEHLCRLCSIYEQIELVGIPEKVPQPPPAENEAGKKPGPMDTQLDALLAGQTAIRQDLSGLRQAVLARFDVSEKTIIATVIERLDQGQLATVQAVLNAIEAGLVPIGELEETLVAVQHTLSEIQQQGVALLDSTLASEVKRLSEIVDAPKLDAKHKLKLTVPIIPVFLSYEGEVELKSGLNLEAVWKRLVGRVRDT